MLSANSHLVHRPQSTEDEGLATRVGGTSVLQLSTLIVTAATEASPRNTTSRQRALNVIALVFALPALCCPEPRTAAGGGVHPAADRFVIKETFLIKQVLLISNAFWMRHVAFASQKEVGGSPTLRQLPERSALPGRELPAPRPAQSASFQPPSHRTPMPKSSSAHSASPPRAPRSFFSQKPLNRKTHSSNHVRGGRDVRVPG